MSTEGSPADDAPEDADSLGPTDATCPMCGCDWAGLSDDRRSEIEAIVAMDERKLAEIEARACAAQPELMWLPTGRTATIGGRVYAEQSAWLFACPLCGGEDDIGWKMWERIK